jgi:hypothetical protein
LPEAVDLAQEGLLVQDCKEPFVLMEVLFGNNSQRRNGERASIPSYMVDESNAFLLLRQQLVDSVVALSYLLIEVGLAVAQVEANVDSACRIDIDGRFSADRRPPRRHVWIKVRRLSAQAICRHGSRSIKDDAVEHVERIGRSLVSAAFRFYVRARQDGRLELVVGGIDIVHGTLTHRLDPQLDKGSLERRRERVDEPLDKLQSGAEIVDVVRKRERLTFGLDLGVLPGATIGLTALQDGASASAIETQDKRHEQTLMQLEQGTLRSHFRVQAFPSRSASLCTLVSR